MDKIRNCVPNVISYALLFVLGINDVVGEIYPTYFPTISHICLWDKGGIFHFNYLPGS